MPLRCRQAASRRRDANEKLTSHLSRNLPAASHITTTLRRGVCLHAHTSHDMYLGTRRHSFLPPLLNRRGCPRAKNCAEVTASGFSSSSQLVMLARRRAMLLAVLTPDRSEAPLS